MSKPDSLQASDIELNITNNSADLSNTLDNQQKMSIIPQTQLNNTNVIITNNRDDEKFINLQNNNLDQENLSENDRNRQYDMVMNSKRNFGSYDGNKISWKCGYRQGLHYLDTENQDSNFVKAQVFLNFAIENNDSSNLKNIEAKYDCYSKIIDLPQMIYNYETVVDVKVLPKFDIKYFKNQKDKTHFLEKAIVFLEKLIKQVKSKQLDIDYESYQFCITKYYYVTGKKNFYLTVKQVEDLIKKSPKNINYYIFKGQLEFENCFCDKAQETFNKMLLLDNLSDNITKQIKKYVIKFLDDSKANFYHTKIKSLIQTYKFYYEMNFNIKLEEDSFSRYAISILDSYPKYIQSYISSQQQIFSFWGYILQEGEEKISLNNRKLFDISNKITDTLYESLKTQVLDDQTANTIKIESHTSIFKDEHILFSSKEQKAFKQIGMNNQCANYFNGYIKAIYSILKDACYINQELCDQSDWQIFKDSLIKYPSFVYLIVANHPDKKHLDYLLYNFNDKNQVDEHTNQIRQVKKHIRRKLGVQKHLIINKNSRVKFVELFLQILYTLILNKEKLLELENRSNLVEKYYHYQQDTITNLKTNQDKINSQKPPLKMIEQNIINNIPNQITKNDNQFYLSGVYDIECLLEFFVENYSKVTAMSDLIEIKDLAVYYMLEKNSNLQPFTPTFIKNKRQHGQFDIATGQLMDQKESWCDNCCGMKSKCTIF